MTRTVARVARAVVVLAALTGLVYPLVMTAVAQVAFHGKADGSLVRAGERTVGSALIGQSWEGPSWFYGRPSATHDDASASSGSNLGPSSRTLARDIQEQVATITKLEGPYHPGLTPADIPVDLLTASASGLDPDISPAAAYFQAPRIAAVRSLPLAEVRSLIATNVEERALGFLGEPRVNVLELNLALAQMRRG